MELFDCKLHEIKKDSVLIKQLQKIFKQLTKIPNQKNIIQVSKLSKTLLCENVMENENFNVKGNIAKCFVDILRIYAPELPFTKMELYEIFRLILSVLEKNEEYAHYLLESLAQVKSCILLIDIGAENEEAPMIVRYFKLLLNMENEQSNEMEGFALNIVHSCLQEMDAHQVSVGIIEVLLEPLMWNETKSSEYSKYGYDLAQRMIQSSIEILHGPLTQYFNTILLGTSGKLGDTQPLAKMELSDDVYILIYEIHKIYAGFLLSILPNVCLQLQAEDENARHDAIALLGRLFASSHANYGMEYCKLFREFLNRFRDQSKHIRLQMVQIAVIIMQRKEELRELLLNELQMRLNDPEWEIRSQVVNDLCDFAAEKSNCISMEVIVAVGERMKDKRLDIRKESMTGLAQLYAQYISNNWEEHIVQTNMDCVQKFKWIPSMLIKCYAYPENEMKIRVLQLLDEIILPRNASHAARARGLLYVFSTLDDAAVMGLRRMLLDRARIQKALLNFVDHVDAYKFCQEQDKDNQYQSIRKCSKELISVLMVDTKHTANNATHESGVNMLLQLIKVKDKSVWHALRKAGIATTSISKIKDLKLTIMKCVGSKTKIGILLKDLLRRCLMQTISQETVGYWLNALESEVIVDHFPLLKCTAEIFPSLFVHAFVIMENEGSKTSSFTDCILRGIESFDSGAFLIGLFANLLMSEYFQSMSSEEQACFKLSMPLQRKLVDICFTGSSSEAKQCCKLLCYSSTIDVRWVAEKLYFRIIEEVQEFQEIKQDQVNHLVCINTLLKHGSLIIDPLSMILQEDSMSIDSIILTLYNTIFNNEENNYGNVKMAKVLGVAVKCLTSYILYKENSMELSQTTELNVETIIACFCAILSNSGAFYKSCSIKVAKFLQAVTSRQMLSIVCIPAYDQLLMPEQWHTLVYNIRDGDNKSRRLFLEKLKSLALESKTPISLKYTSAIVLASNDVDVTIRKTARNVLTAIVARMRSIHQSTRNASTQSSMDSQTSGDSLLACVLPEYMIPYVVHLIVHLPDFTKVGSTVLVNYCQFMLDILVSNHAAEADNLSFIFKLLTLLSKCNDRLSSISDANQRLSTIVSNCIASLKKKIKSQHNLRPYPGLIYLPRQLYQSKRDAGESDAIDDGITVNEVNESSTAVKKKSAKTSQGRSKKRSKKKRVLENVVPHRR